MKRVFVTNYAGHDFAKAENFGEIYFLTRGYISLQSLDRVNFLVAKAMHDYDITPEDYLLLSGMSIICVMSAVLWYHKFSSCNLLIWDPPSNTYRELKLNANSYNVLVREILTLNESEKL